MFPVYCMDCWSLYILEAEKKIFRVLNPTETHPSDGMETKHSAFAKRTQRRFWQCFNNIFGGWLVDVDGWTSVYPLVAHRDPCTREESGIYIVHYIHEFNGLYLRLVMNIGYSNMWSHLCCKYCFITYGKVSNMRSWLWESIRVTCQVSCTSKSWTEGMKSE